MDGTLKKIVDRVWEPQTDFQKLNTVYMEWYRTSEAEQEEKKKGKQLMLDYIKKRKMTDEGKRFFLFGFKMNNRSRMLLTERFFIDGS